MLRGPFARLSLENVPLLTFASAGLFWILNELLFSKFHAVDSRRTEPRATTPPKKRPKPDPVPPRFRFITRKKQKDVIMSFLMYLCPVIVCKNQGCESQPIRLPYPNPPRTSELRPDWPSADWKPFVACFECGHSYLYTAEDVHWGAFETQELGRKQTWVKYALQCAHSDCGLPIEFYVCVVGAIEPEALWDRFYEATQRPTCEKDHSLTRDSLRVSATTVDQLSPLQRMRQAS